MTSEPTAGPDPPSPTATHPEIRTDEAGLRRYATASGPFVLRPRGVARPRTVDEVRELVRWAAETGTSLTPRGAGTGMPGGNVGSGVAVDVTALSGIGEVDVDRSLVTVGPGAVAGEVQRAAARAGLFFPPLPSSADRCTIGGMVANNAAGARTFKYGAVRDWVRALEVVLADGRVVRLDGSEHARAARPDASAGDSRSPGHAEHHPLPEPFEDLWRRLRPRWQALADEWPGVRKNSSGYALDRFIPSGNPVELMVGSEGTLGLVTSATLRLAPLPEARALTLISVSRPDELLEVIRAAGEAGASACEFFSRSFLDIAQLDDHPRFGPLARGQYALAMVELDGSPSRVARGVERMRGAADALSSGVIEAREAGDRRELWSVRRAASPVIARAAEEGRVSMQFIEDSAVPPQLLPDYLRGLEQILLENGTDAVVFGHAGDGNVHVNPLVDTTRRDWRETVGRILEETAGLVARLGGTLSGEHGDGRVRAPYLETVWPALAVRSFRDVKETLDPDNLLNPGVIVPLDGQDPLEGIADARRA